MMFRGNMERMSEMLKRVWGRDLTPEEFEKHALESGLRPPRIVFVERSAEWLRDAATR